MKNEIFDLKEVYASMEEAEEVTRSMYKKMAAINGYLNTMVNAHKDKFTEHICDMDEAGLRIRDDFAPYVASKDCYVQFIYIDKIDKMLWCYCGDEIGPKPAAAFIRNGEILYIFNGILDEFLARGWVNDENPKNININ